MSADARPAVLVTAPVAHLERHLGLQRAAAVRDLLLARALAWAESVAPPAVLRAAAGEAPGAAAQRAFADVGGPLLIAWPELPAWSAVHGDCALDDLAAGCPVSIGPVFDGGFYLVGLAGPLPGLLEALAGTDADAMTRAFTSAHEAGIEVGLLRAERGLRTEADIAAALADPLLDAELRAILS